MSIPTQDTAPKPVTFSPKLPPELWEIIFIFATFGESGFWCRGTAFEYRLVTKRSLVLVCRLWHAIALPLLYNFVWTRDASTARRFLRTLVDTASTEDTPTGYGKWIRSIILPGEIGSQDWRGFHIADLLNRCPNVRVVLKTADMNDDFWHGIACTASCLACSAIDSFTSLQYIAWVCSPNPATISIDSQRLSTILQYAPNLTFLLVVNRGRAPFSIRLTSSASMKKLTCLQYLTGETPVAPASVAPLCLRQSDMPHLSCISAGLAALTARDPIDGDEDRSSLLSVFGKQLKVLSLFHSAPSVSGGIVHDIRSILLRCPNLHMFCFNVFPTVLPEGGVLHPSLEVIVLRITAGQQNDEELERFLRAHIKTIMGEAFPGLRRVWLSVVGRSARQFYPACGDLLKRFPKGHIVGANTVWES